MEKIIACCGLDCSTCDARKATLANDDVLRARTAEQWRTHFNAPDITPEMINCTGCREAGAKFGHCFQCEIRNCVKDKNFSTCADCETIETCNILGNIFKFVPDALDNLKSLN